MDVVVADGSHLASLAQLGSCRGGKKTQEQRIAGIAPPGREGNGGDGFMMKYFGVEGLSR